MNYADQLEAFPQLQDMAQWASWLDRAGYVTELHAVECVIYGLDGKPTDETFPPFNWEWHVFEGWHGLRVATISHDGCGCSWAGPDDLFARVIAPNCD